MKLYVSFDMEGISGIVDWEQCTGDGPDYQIGKDLTLGEVNAAIEGAIEGGVEEVWINDSHYRMRNLNPADLSGNASYVSGSHKPMYMMEGLDDTFDMVFFIGYHGSISGEPSILSHTYNPAVFSRVSLNGIEVGESGINALVALGYGIPIALITGDRATHEQANKLLGDVRGVVVKESISRFAATNLHPCVARSMVRDAAREAAQEVASLAPPAISLPAVLEMEFQTSDLAELACWVKGVERVEGRRAAITGEDALQIYRSFVAVSYITRQSGGR